MTIGDPKSEKTKEIMEEAFPSSAPITNSKLRTRNITVLAFISIFTAFADGIYFIFYTPYFLEVNNSVKLIGIISTCSAVFAVLGLIVADFIYEKIGYKRLYIIALILTAVGYGIFIFSTISLVWIIIAIFLLRFVYSLGEAPNSIIITETAGEKKKGKISSLLFIFYRIGEIILNAIIPIVAVTIIYTNKERSYFFIVATAVYIVISLIALLFITDPRKLIIDKSKGEKITKNDEEKVEEEKLEIEPTNFIKSFINTFKDGWVLKVAIIFFFDSLVWSIGFGVYTAGLLDENLLGVFALNDELLSIIYLTVNITILITQFPAGWLVDKIGAKTTSFIAEGLGIIWAILAIIYVFIPQYFWILIISRVIIGLHIALWIPSSLALFTNVDKKRKSKVYNAIATFRTIGGIPGGLIAGLMYDWIILPFGYITPLLILIVGLIALIPAFYLLPNKPPEKNEMKEKNVL